MKIRSAEYPLIGALFGVLLLFGGCKGEPSCPDEKVTYHFLGEYKRSRIPYSGFDTLRFIANNEVTYVGNGTKQLFTERKTRDPNPDCNVYQTDRHEVLQFIFYTKNNTDSLFLQMEDYSGNCTFIGNNCTFYFYREVIKNLEQHVDSIYLHNKWYFNHTTLINPQLDTLVVNKEYGILKCVNYSTGQQLTLKQ